MERLGLREFLSKVRRGRRAAQQQRVFNKPPANPQAPFPSPSGGRWHPPIPREADDGRGRTSPLADGKTVAFPRSWRSFPHRGSAAFSLSGRPCGRHPPPLGEGPGEGALVVSPGTVLIDNFFPREAQNLSSRTLPPDNIPTFPRTPAFFVGGFSLPIPPGVAIISPPADAGGGAPFSFSALRRLCAHGSAAPYRYPIGV